MLGLAHATVALWCGSGLAAAVVAIPVADLKVPLFTIMFIPVYAILLSIVALEGLAALAPNGYQSQIGRAAKAPGAIEELGFPGSGWIERVQSSQYNTWESAILAVCCFVVAIEEKLTPSLFSSSRRLLVCRLVYRCPTRWTSTSPARRRLTGLYATIMVAACALYPTMRAVLRLGIGRVKSRDDNTLHYEEDAPRATTSPSRSTSRGAATRPPSRRCRARIVAIVSGPSPDRKPAAARSTQSRAVRDARPLQRREHGRHARRLRARAACASWRPVLVRPSPTTTASPVTTAAALRFAPLTNDATSSTTLPSLRATAPGRGPDVPCQARPV